MIDIQAVEELRKNSYIEDIKEMIEDDPDLAIGSEDEIIYQIDDLKIYGGFYGTKIRTVDHNVLKLPDVEWEDIINWGTVVVPETRSYISDDVIEDYEKMGFSNIPIDENHINGREEPTKRKSKDLIKELER